MQDDQGNILMVTDVTVVVSVPPDTPFDELKEVVAEAVKEKIRMPLTCEPRNIHPFKSLLELLETGAQVGFGAGAWTANRDLAINLVEEGSAPEEIKLWVENYKKSVAAKKPTVLDHFGPSITT